jgi:hypothetical protein
LVFPKVKPDETFKSSRSEALERHPHRQGLVSEIEDQPWLVDQAVAVVVGPVRGLTFQVASHGGAQDRRALPRQAGVLDQNEVPLVGKPVSVVVDPVGELETAARRGQTAVVRRIGVVGREDPRQVLSTQDLQRCCADSRASDALRFESLSRMLETIAAENPPKATAMRIVAIMISTSEKPELAWARAAGAAGRRRARRRPAVRCGRVPRAGRSVREVTHGWAARRAVGASSQTIAGSATPGAP